MMKRAKRGGPSGKLRVGVTLFVRGGPQSIWENGIFQNCFFLLKLLQKSPEVDYCCIVKGGPGDPDSAGDFLAGANADIIDFAAAMQRLDVIIELSAQIDHQWAQQFSDQGGRIIGMRVANDFVIDAERVAFDLSPALLMAGTPYDQIWTLPAFEKSCAGYYAAGSRAPVRVMQHLWSPDLLEMALRQGGAERQFAYVPGRKQWRVAVLEPNISSVKSCHLPLLACDMAHRNSPRMLEVVRVFNAMQLKESATFVNFARSTDLVQQGLATFEARYAIADVMGPMADAVVSHHWENAQNYLYYELLYGGFPLIHNSDLIADCGYRYRDYDPEDGGAALIQAFLQHDRNLDAYRANAQNLLARLDPCAEHNIALYSRALTELYSHQD